jgi:hypothetical protein
MAGVRFTTGRRDFSFLYNFKTGSGAHPDSYKMGTEAYLPGDIAAGEGS